MGGLGWFLCFGSHKPKLRCLWTRLLCRGSGKNPLPGYSGHWPNPVPCGDGAEEPTSLLAVSQKLVFALQGCLHSMWPLQRWQVKFLLYFKLLWLLQLLLFFRAHASTLEPTWVFQILSLFWDQLVINVSYFRKAPSQQYQINIWLTSQRMGIWGWIRRLELPTSGLDS